MCCCQEDDIDVIFVKSGTWNVGNFCVGGKWEKTNDGAKVIYQKNEDLKAQGAVSAVVAYQMAVGLLKEGADIAVSTTGIAGPKSDDTDKPVGLCYIAVGMKDGVHTYRYKLSGTREEITETAKNTALFLAIKKLKSL